MGGFRLGYGSVLVGSGLGPSSAACSGVASGLVSGSGGAEKKGWKKH